MLFNVMWSSLSLKVLILTTMKAMPASQVIALIESLSTGTPAAQDPAKQEADAQQALTLLASQQPLNLELHAKLAKAALQAGATTAAIQAATALVGAALPQGRAAQDIVEASDAPGITAGDWQWLAVASYVLGQVSMSACCLCTIFKSAALSCNM